MAKNLLPKSIRKYLEKEKALWRRLFSGPLKKSYQSNG